MANLVIRRSEGDDLEEVSRENPLPVTIEEVVSSAGIPLGQRSESITVSTTAIGLTTIPPGARSAIVSVEADAVRFWFDGSTPTASVGHRANVDDVITLVNPTEVTRFKVIRVTTDATLRVSYLG